MRKTIPFEVFGPNQYLYFDIKRLMKLEEVLGKSIANIVARHEITINFIVAGLMIGLSHHSKDTSAQWGAKVEKYFEDGRGDIETLALPILQAIVASGIFGKIDGGDGGDEKNSPLAAGESTV